MGVFFNRCIAPTQFHTEPSTRMSLYAISASHCEDSGGNGVDVRRSHLAVAAEEKLLELEGLCFPKVIRDGHERNKHNT